MCKYSGWVEILGCGMVDQMFWKIVGIDSKNIPTPLVWVWSVLLT